MCSQPILRIRAMRNSLGKEDRLTLGR
jgi:hypothetical protein